MSLYDVDTNTLKRFAEGGDTASNPVTRILIATTSANGRLLTTLAEHSIGEFKLTIRATNDFVPIKGILVDQLKLPHNCTPTALRASTSVWLMVDDAGEFIWLACGATSSPAGGVVMQLNVNHEKWTIALSAADVYRANAELLGARFILPQLTIRNAIPAAFFIAMHPALPYSRSAFSVISATLLPRTLVHNLPLTSADGGVSCVVPAARSNNVMIVYSSTSLQSLEQYENFSAIANLEGRIITRKLKVSGTGAGDCERLAFSASQNAIFVSSGKASPIIQVHNPSFVSAIPIGLGAKGLALSPSEELLAVRRENAGGGSIEIIPIGKFQ